jgi:hypothetical protein
MVFPRSTRKIAAKDDPGVNPLSQSNDQRLSGPAGIGRSDGGDRMPKHPDTPDGLKTSKIRPCAFLWSSRPASVTSRSGWASKWRMQVPHMELSPSCHPP